MAQTPKEIVIYHNPSCATSRKVLGMLRGSGIEPRVIEYLKTPPSRDALQTMLNQMGMTPRQLLRKKGNLYTELGLDDPKKSDDAILDAIQSHPVLMERPIVVSNRGTAVCRPPDRVNALLP